MRNGVPNRSAAGCRRALAGFSHSIDGWRSDARPPRGGGSTFFDRMNCRSAAPMSGAWNAGRVSRRPRCLTRDGKAQVLALCRASTSRTASVPPSFCSGSFAPAWIKASIAAG